MNLIAIARFDRRAGRKQPLHLVIARLRLHLLHQRVAILQRCIIDTRRRASESAMGRNRFRNLIRSTEFFARSKIVAVQERLQRTAMSPQCPSKSESDSKIAACAAGAMDESCRKTAAYFMELTRELGNRIDRSIEKWHVYLLDLFWQLRFTRNFVRESCEGQLIDRKTIGHWCLPSGSTSVT